MSYIPDCRAKHDEYGNINPYWYKLLKGKDAEFIKGFDWCMEMCVNNLFDNLDVYAHELLDADVNVRRIDTNIVNGACGVDIEGKYITEDEDLTNSMMSILKKN